MRSVLCRYLLAGLLLSTSGWLAPAQAQSMQPGAPAPDAQASAGRFTELCVAKLKLAPEQAAALHTYLDQEVNYLNVLAQNNLNAETPDLVPTETQQFDQVVAKLLSPNQLQGFQKLAQTVPAQTYLRSMALLPAPPDNLAQADQPTRHQRRAARRMMAQRLDAAD